MEGYRLSPQQQNLLDSLQTSGRDVPWSNDCCVDVRGELDLQRLNDNLARLVGSEEILRTYYPVFAGVRVQAVADSPCWNGVDFVDLSSFDRAEQARRVEAHRVQSRSRIPERPAEILRAAVFKIAHLRHVLLLTCVAPASDVAGQSLLARRLAQLYAAATPAPGEAPVQSGVQYADLAEWFHNVLEDPESGGGRRYWRDLLSEGVHDPEPFPLVQPAEERRFSPARLSVPLAGESLKQADELAAELGVGRREIFLAAWAALVWRLNGAEDYTLGVSCDGRTQRELESCLGLLAKVLPIPIECDSSTTFSDLVRRLGRTWLESESRQEYLDLRLLGGESLGLGTSLLKVAFAYLAADWKEDSAGVSFSLQDVAAHEQPFLLKLGILSTERQLRADLWFDAASVSAEQAERLVARLGILFERAASDPETSLAQLPILISQDWEAINRNVAPRDATAPDHLSCVVSRFVELAEQQPDAPAVSCGEATLSYAQLNERSNRLANFLLRRGIEPDMPVAVCMQRGPEAIVGILGVLKAGAGYVPLDPDYPPDRIALVLADSGAATLLAEEKVADRFPDLSADVVCVDRDHAEIAACSSDAPASRAKPEHLAYLLYTSGSTGRPKGVVVTRANLAYSTGARFAFYEQAPGAFLLLSSFAFDSSVAGIFWTLTGGGHLVFSGADTAIDVDQIAGAIHRHGVTHTLCLPSVYSTLLETVSPGVLRSLACVIVAGESCAAAVVSEHMRRCPQARLFNEYGPTECTVWCTAYECDAVGIEGAAVPIGTAIPGTTVMVLSSELTPTPIECRGELYVTGPGLTNGYRGRPDLTQERYVAVEVPGHGLCRAYRTGDIARLKSDGNIDFLGRRDFQVKVNGYRIELEEVESTIRGLPGVQDAVVVIRETAAGDKQLAAFMRLKDSSGIEDIETRLAKTLPRYMIPSLLSVVQDFPRTPNGKIDRQALMTADVEQASAGGYASPRNHLEQLQAELWAELLNRDRIGIEDDFFRLGGHSILATRLIARLNDVMQLSVPMRVLFESPTITRFTEALRRDPKIGPELPRIEAVLAQVAGLEAGELDERMLELPSA